ncbi:hypothetical protein ACH5RR_007727 [Cinchona calisaya]|uniref:Ubiquitin-like protease family profile domain-containing protein n=1 Tax=Cinchona calisaya TaxID=153742 RepID=A0ABD3AD73_9GENT
MSLIFGLLIFVPVNAGDHWYSMVAHVEKEQVYVLDTIHHETSYYNPIKELVGWLVNQLINKTCNWTFYLVRDIHKQKDSNSCGPLALKLMQCWAMGYQPSFSNLVDYRIARNFIALEIAMDRPINSLMYDREIHMHQELGYGPPKKLLVLDLNGVLLRTHWEIRDPCNDFARYLG